MKNTSFQHLSILFLILLSVFSFACKKQDQKALKLLNVSYDPTREFYEEYNTQFKKYWKSKTNRDIEFSQSHGGSGKQARSVIDGLEADVVTLALAYDIDGIAEKARLLPENWQQLFPHNSSPYTSTLVFLVRKDNPKNIKDWNDLVRPDVAVITPNPKTSGGARWNYLAAWSFAQKQFNNDESQAKNFIKTLYQNVPVLDSGARGSTTTFVERKIGDVLIAWENEALLSLQKMGKNNLEIVYPSSSILAEPPVAVVEKVAQKHGLLEEAKAYLEYLYSPEAQEIAAKNFYRPRLESVAAKYSEQFPKLNLVTVDELGGWKNLQKTHFSDGGIFDQLYGK